MVKSKKNYMGWAKSEYVDKKKRVQAFGGKT
jgi:hypothetical protein